jgi:hypothetical protein
MIIQDTLFLERFTKKYPLITPLLQRSKHPFINIDLRIIESWGGKSEPHTEESIERKTNFPFYDHWKKLVVQCLGQKGLDYLVKQKEFF